MNAPTVKRMIEVLGIDPEVAKIIRQIMKFNPSERNRYDRAREFLTFIGEIPGIDPAAVRAAEVRDRESYNPHPWQVLALEAIDVLLGTYGTEGFCNTCGSRGFSYCNTGDTYGATIGLIDEDRWYLGSWGDHFEANEARYS